MPDVNCIIIQTALDRRSVIVFRVIFLTENARFEMWYCLINLGFQLFWTENSSVLF